MLFAAILAVGANAAEHSFATVESHYEINLSEIGSARLRITLDAACQTDPCDFQMAVWSATYQVRDFSQFVLELKALDSAGKLLRTTKVTPSTWRVRGQAAKRVRLEYSVLADRPGPFGAYADEDLVNLNLAQVLIYPVDGVDGAFSLDLINRPANFKEALELPLCRRGYCAADFATLVDTPVHLADFEATQYEIEGKRVRVVASGSPGRFDLDLLENTTRRIVEAGAELMGELPFERYTFVYVFSDGDGGGMEYRNGTVIYGPADCRTCGMPALSAHEFFHLWNVKRIRPESMDPVDFSRPNPSPSLWFAEGVTSTYAQYLQIRAGLMAGTDLISHVEQLINDYETRPAARLQSAEDSSVEAWLERYPAYSRGDRSVSYYLKGELIGHLLDIAIRHHSGNRNSLDDAMRRLNENSGLFADSQELATLMGELAGVDFEPIFDQLVRTAEPIPWDEYLGYAGLRLISEQREQTTAGMTLANPAGLGMVVVEVLAGGPAEKAGFRRGDRLVRIEGRRVSGAAYEIGRRIARASGRATEITIERRGLFHTLRLKPGKVTSTQYRIVDQDQVSAAQRKVREGWLTRTTDSIAPSL